MYHGQSSVGESGIRVRVRCPAWQASAGQGEDHPRPGLSSSREGRFVLLGGAARWRAACFSRAPLPSAPPRWMEADLALSCDALEVAAFHFPHISLL